MLSTSLGFSPTERPSSWSEMILYRGVFYELYLPMLLILRILPLILCERDSSTGLSFTGDWKFFSSLLSLIGG